MCIQFLNITSYLCDLFRTIHFRSWKRLAQERLKGKRAWCPQIFREDNNTAPCSGQASSTINVEYLFWNVNPHIDHFTNILTTTFQWNLVYKPQKNFPIRSTAYCNHYCCHFLPISVKGFSFSRPSSLNQFNVRKILTQKLAKRKWMKYQCAHLILKEG